MDGDDHNSRVCIAEPLKKGRDLLLNNEEREVLGEWLQKRSFANVIVILSRTADDDDRTSENKIEEKACLKKKCTFDEKKVHLSATLIKIFTTLERCRMLFLTCTVFLSFNVITLSS